MVVERYYHLKFRGIFPPEKAARGRPVLEAFQAMVDERQEEIHARVMTRIAHDLLYGSEPSDFVGGGIASIPDGPFELEREF